MDALGMQGEIEMMLRVPLLKEIKQPSICCS